MPHRQDYATTNSFDSFPHRSERQKKLWQQQVTQELRQNPQLTTDFEATQDSQTTELKKRTAFDPFSVFREFALQNWNPEHQQDVKRLQQQLQEIFKTDLQVFVEEHFRLQYQSRQLEFNPEDFFNSMLASCAQNDRKELALLKQADSYQAYRLHFIRFHRSLLEHQQVKKMQQVVDNIFREKLFTKVLAGDVFGPTTKEDLNTLGFKPTVALPEIIHQGRLVALGLTSDEEVFVSPRFGLAMPANAYVHPGNQAYANTYQIVAKLDHQGQPVKYWLLSDHYYSDLSLNELQAVLNDWQLNSPAAPQENSSGLPEEIIMSAVDSLPSRYTHQKPFLTFINLATKLQKEAQLSPELVLDQQTTVTGKVKNRQQDIDMAAALLTEILLTELALCRYLPPRHDYVGEVLQSAFEMVVLPLIVDRDLHYTPDLYQEIKSNYHRVWVEYKLTGVDPFEDDWATKQAKTSQIHQVFAQSSLTALDQPAMQQSFGDDEVFVRQLEATKKDPSLVDFGNLMLVFSSLPEAIQGVASCAACAGGMFGGLKNTGGASTSTTGLQGDLAGSGSSGWGMYSNLSGQAPPDFTQINGKDIFDHRLGNFANGSYSTASNAVQAFEGTIAAGDFLNFIISPAWVYR